MFRGRKGGKSRRGIPKFGNLTEFQFKIMNAMIQASKERPSSIYKRASEILKMKPGTLRANVFWIRRKYDKCKSVTTAIEEKQRELPRGKRYFTG